METADGKNKNIYTVLIIVLAVAFAAGAFFLFKNGSGNIKNFLPVNIKNAKIEFPSDPIEILEYAENLERASRYHLASSISRAVTGEEKQTIQEIYKTDGADNARADFLKDGLLYARMFLNKEGVWQCDYLTPKDGEKPDCYKYGEKPSFLPKSFNPDVLRKWRDAGFVVFETKKETRRVGDEDRKCEYVGYQLKTENFSPELIQPLMSQYGIVVSDEDTREFSENISGLTLHAEQCFDSEIGAPIYSRSFIKYKEFSAEDLREAMGLVIGDRAIDKITLTEIAKNLKDTTKYFYSIYPYKDVFYVRTYDDKFAVVKNGEIKIIEEMYRPINITAYNDIPIVNTLFKGMWKYENDKWSLIESAGKIGFVSRFLDYQNALHAITTKGIFKLSSGVWEQVFLFDEKVEDPTEVLSYNGGIYFLTSSDGLYFYHDGILEKITPKENIDYGSKFIMVNGKPYIKSTYSLSALENNSVREISNIKDNGEVISEIEYNGKLYFSTRKGVYREIQGGVEIAAKSDLVGEVNDFAIYQGVLYMGGEKGVYFMSDNGGFFSAGDYNMFTEVNDLYVFNGALYAGDVLVLARWQGAEWETLDRDNVKRFFEHEGSLYAETEAGNAIEKIGSELNSALFYIPKESERQIINN